MLEFGEVPTPKPGAGEVLVDVEAAGVNFIDTYRRTGVYPMEYPHIAGSEGTGRIAEVGEGIESWSVGDRCREAAFGSTCVTNRCVTSVHRGH
ncbi:alcohol dehydrogenase catalytic domain-containing protein [Brevibacterium aurantiacum]|uniref:alcohol dehydrogenase catalytic domain-containing protein n=1 Tax=Brevibacterium aurantiacum TaxID=273384 RepID=UPI0001BC2E1E